MSDVSVMIAIAVWVVADFSTSVAESENAILSAV
jgi:hypothetical protein